MSRSFRFVPPEPRSDLLTRPRLLRVLVRRWQRRITAVTGGPGLGKTTLLAQAIAENRLAPRGDDVWVGVEPRDADAERLSRVVAAAVAGRRIGPDGDLVGDPAGGGGPGPGAGGTGGGAGGIGTGVGIGVDRGYDGVVDPGHVADQLWQRSPTEACLVLDDVHLLPPGSSGARWLAALVDALPDNGHVVLASRTDPPVPLGRYGAHGHLQRLTEDDLRFSERELTGFAAQRGLDPERLATTGGWPAMAELTASVEQHVTGSYLWEEVLEPLGPRRRHILSVVCDLGRADDELATAATGSRTRLADALDGVPLVVGDDEGWYEAHGLWRTAPRIALPVEAARIIRRRAVRNLAGRGRFDAAFELIEQAGLWDEAPAVLRLACITGERPSRQLGRWLASCPDEVRRSPAGRLAAGLHAASTSPEKAFPPLREAAERFREADDPPAELVAVAQMGRMAWWWQDLQILAELSPRVYELHQAGHPMASALLSLGWALANDIGGIDANVLKQLDRIPPGVLDPATELLSRWFAGAVHLYSGRLEPAEDIAREMQARADPDMRYIADTLDLMCLWVRGRVDEVVERTPGVVAAARASGIVYTLSLGVHTASLALSHVGDVDRAREYLAEARAAAPTDDDGHPTVHTAVATASLRLAEGDEAAATATLRQAIEHHELDTGVDRRWWRQMISLCYVLVPESRAHWDGVSLRGHLAVCRDLGAAVVAARSDDPEGPLRSLHLPDLAVVRAGLHHRHAAELAVGLTAAGRQEGRRLLDLLGPAGREAVRALATDRGPHARPAKALLAAVPAPPPHVTRLSVLGPLELRRGAPDSAPVDDPDLRRQRVQELLAYLVGHRRTTRGAVMAALWPDLDERSAGNNLGVTLNRLLRLLEPWRRTGEPAFYVRMDGPGLQLVTGEHLVVDVDMFDERIALAARAEADGIPSLALEHNLAAVDLHRDRLHVDLPEAEWLTLDREHYRTRFVRAAVRAAQLLLGHGEIDRSHAVAQRALAADPWSEDAYVVLVGGALARGDRSAARRLLDHCLETLADLGATPSLATEQLRRRVQPT